MSLSFEQWIATKRDRLAGRADAFEAITSRLVSLGREITIVETGCARLEGNWAGDGQSTLVWDALVNDTGGIVLSVDIDPKAVSLANSLTSDLTRVECNDSVQWLMHMAVCGLSVDFLYLDSYDIDWANPRPSMEHHERELDAAWPMLQPGTIVAVDDNQPNVGKGYLVGLIAERNNWETVADGYVRAWSVA